MPWVPVQPQVLVVVKKVMALNDVSLRASARISNVTKLARFQLNCNSRAAERKIQSCAASR